MATQTAERTDSAPPAAAAWGIDAARALYNIEGWGAGFFDVNEKGHVVVRPDRDHPEVTLDLYDIAMDLEEQGIALPVLLRFSDILRARIEALNTRFQTAIQEFEYKGGYTTVYPIKVNQQRHVVEEIVEFGKEQGVGLECGSKPELQAILGMAEHTDHLIVCNGYKDEEFMRLALMGQKLGHRVFVVLEQLKGQDFVLVESILEKFLKKGEKRTTDMFFNSLTFLYSSGAIERKEYKIRLVVKSVKQTSLFD
jgi:arginine decarboxylase